jgi:hypothetical protein
MGIRDWLLGRRSATGYDFAFTKEPKLVQAAPGQEDATFLREAAVVLACQREAIDLSKDIVSEYRCDQIGLIELVQVAEDVWGTPLMPNPIGAADAAQLGRRFRTLGDIVAAAKNLDA